MVRGIEPGVGTLTVRSGQFEITVPAHVEERVEKG
jgi:hypothetical protein